MAEGVEKEMGSGAGYWLWGRAASVTRKSEDGEVAEQWGTRRGWGVRGRVSEAERAWHQG